MNMFSGLKGEGLPVRERLPHINFPRHWGLTWAGNSFDLQHDVHDEPRPVKCVRCGGLRTPMCIHPRLGCRCAL